jgi:hypothetical protein
MNILLAIMILASLELAMLLLLCFTQLRKVKEHAPDDSSLTSGEIGSLELMVSLYHLPILMLATRYSKKECAPYNLVSKLTFLLYLSIYVLTGQHALALHPF